MKTEKVIKLKAGGELPKGLPVTFEPGKDSTCLVHGDRVEPYRVRITSAFRAPSMESLEEWCCDSICESVGGDRVEPDGHGEHGDPSWLLALGMI